MHLKKRHDGSVLSPKPKPRKVPSIKPQQLQENGPDFVADRPMASLEVMPTKLQDLAQPDEGYSTQQSQASLLIKFVMECFRLFHDFNRVVFCQDIDSGKVFLLESQGFRDCIQAGFYQAFGHSPREQSVREALGTLAGMGRHNSPRLCVELRTAGGNGDYYLDLAVPGNRETVRLRSGCWDIVDSTETMFFQPDSMQQLPFPVPGGSIERLWQVVNIPANARLLVLTWLIDCLRPDTPYPLLELIGEHGTAKSATQKILRCLIDPNGCNLRGAPRSAEDIYVSASASAILSYENVSHLTASTQDALCVVATGGGYAKRKLYSNFDESVIEVKRPIILNGIAASVTAQDLVDRTISVELPVIVARRETTEVWNEFEQLAPSLLGALLDIAAKALELLPSVQLPAEKRPRLLEYARLGMAVAQAMGNEPEAFLREFNASRQESLRRTIDESPVATAIQELISDRPGGVTDSVKGLLAMLEKYCSSNSGSWPKSPKGLGDALRRVAPALRQLGIQCEPLGKGSGGIIRWAIRKESGPSQEDSSELS